MPSSSSCLPAVSALCHCFQHGLFLLPSQEVGVGGMPGRRVFPTSATQGAGSEGHPNPAVPHDSVLNEPVCKGGALGLLGVCAQRLKMSSSGVIIRFGFLNTHLLSLPCFQRQRSSHCFLDSIPSGLLPPAGDRTRCSGSPRQPISAISCILRTLPRASSWNGSDHYLCTLCMTSVAESMCGRVHGVGDQDVWASGYDQHRKVWSL